jgi:hypothetical protein
MVWNGIGAFCFICFGSRIHRKQGGSACRYRLRAEFSSGLVLGHLYFLSAITDVVVGPLE